MLVFMNSLRVEDIFGLLIKNVIISNTILHEIINLKKYISMTAQEQFLLQNLNLLNLHLNLQGLIDTTSTVVAQGKEKLLVDIYGDINRLNDVLYNIKTQRLERK